MTTNDDIVFEDNSGISAEEQKEIMSKINHIAEKNRSSLSEGKKTSVKAKKSGAGFPLIVNILAVIVFCGGAALLILFNRGIDIQRRTGGVVFNVTERAVIDEIRKDTAQKIAEKDREIALITARMTEIDEQLLLLFSESSSLTNEQLADRERLLSMQVLFRNDLNALQQERVQILEESRAMEADLRARLAERTRSQQIMARELDSAMLEIERLKTEQDRLAAMDALIAGGLSLGGGDSTDHLQLQEQIVGLQNTVNEMQMTIETLSSGGSAEAGRILELERTALTMRETITGFEQTASTMRETITGLEQTIAERDTEIAAMETERASLQSLNATQEQEITTLRNQIDVIRQMLLDNE